MFRFPGSRVRSTLSTLIVFGLVVSLLTGCGLFRKLDEGRETDLRIECWVTDPANPDGERVMELLEAAECRERGGRVQ